jgi:glycosyl hydrolase family 95
MGGRYFMNYNEEAPFYGVFSSNHSELVEPYNRMVLAQIPWQKNRTAAAGYQGVSFQRTFSPFTMYQPAPASVPVASAKDYKKLPSDQKSNATFSVLPLIEYYEYTRDQIFLRKQLYPALKELDAFWRDFAVHNPEGTQWIFEHSSAHEGGDDVNPNLDLGFARRVARELIETSQVLGVDAEMRPVWHQFIDQLAPYPSGTVNGKTVYYIAASVKNNVKNQGLFEPGDQPINLEGLVYPGENLAIGGDAQQLEIARNSMEEMNSWGVSRGGNSNNGFCKIFPIAARIGWPADDLVNKIKAAILHQWRPANLTVFQGGGGIETSGSVEALDSMLLQHEDGVLRVFPDWPTTMDASFTRLRAKGAFLISSDQHAGTVSYIDVASETGGSLVIQSPWGSHNVRVSGAGKFGGRTLTPDANGHIILVTVSGGQYHLVLQ